MTILIGTTPREAPGARMVRQPPDSGACGQRACGKGYGPSARVIPQPRRVPSKRRIAETRWTDPLWSLGVGPRDGDTARLLQQLPQFVGGQLASSEDSVKQTGTDGLARVHGHNRAPANLVTH